MSNGDIVKFGDLIGIIDCFKNFYLLNDDGSVSFCIELFNKDDSSLNDIDIMNNLRQQVNSFYKLLDEKTEISFIQFPEKNTALLNNYINNCNNCDILIKTINDFYKNVLIKEHNNFSFTKLRSILFFRFYLKVFAIPYNNRKMSYSEYDNIVKDITNKSSMFTEALKAININHRLLNITEIHKIISYLVNPFTYCYENPISPINFFYKHNSIDTKTEPDGFIGLPLSDQFSSYSTLYPDKLCPYFVYDDNKLYMNAIRVKNLSRDLKYGIFRNILSSNLPIFMITNLNAVKQQNFQHLLNASIRRKGHSIKQDDDHSESQVNVHNDERDLLNKLESGGNLLFNADINLILFSSDKDFLLKQATSTIAYLNTQGIIAYNDVGRVLYYYINSLPFKSRNSLKKGVFNNVKVKIDEFVKPKKRSSSLYSLNLKRIITENLPFFVDLYDSDPGHPNPFILFRNSLTKRPVGFDPFDQSYMQASNIVITGSTGSGKSVVSNLILSRLLNRKDVPWVFTLDRGSSSKNLATLLGGASLRIDPRDKNSTLNIFDTDIEDIDNPKSAIAKEKLTDIAHYLFALVFQNEIPKDIDLHTESLIENIIRETYIRKKSSSGIKFDTSVPNSFPIISDFLTTLKSFIKSKDPLYHQPIFDYLYKNLNTYTEGEYSFLVNSYSPIFSTKKFMSFDIDYIFNSKKILSSEIIKISSLISNCTNKLFKENSKTKWIFFIDEMWSYFMRSTHSDATNHMAYVIESGIREARKKGGLLINATQNFSDLLSTPTIINNSPIKMLGKTYDNAEIELIENTLKLKPFEKSLLLNTGVVASQYSRFFIDVAGKFRSLVDIVLTPLELAILTTNSDDLSHIKDWFNNNNKQINNIYDWIEYSQLYPYSSFTERYKSQEI